MLTPNQCERCDKRSQLLDGRQTGTWERLFVVVETSNDTPLSFQNVVNRVILPTLDRCQHCGESEDDHQPRLIGDKKPCPGYERDERIPEWHGFHAARRGLGSNLHRLGVPSLLIQRILRHSNVATTEGYYIKSNDADVAAAMLKFEESLQATLRPESHDADEQPKFVN